MDKPGLPSMSLPFLSKKPIDLPPIVSIELIQITDKTNIPFVQGMFNQGGTATLRFSGKKNINLIATRKNPQISKKEKLSQDEFVDLARQISQNF